MGVGGGREGDEGEQVIIARDVCDAVHALSVKTHGDVSKKRAEDGAMEV